MSLFHWAVWGSLGANLVLGAWMWVQAATDPARRRRFASFASACWGIAILDFMAPHLSLSDYEMLRLLAWSAYGAALLWLLESSPLWLLAVAGTCLTGLGVWRFWRPEMAAPVAFPLIFILVALAHARQFWRRGGYASCLLCAQAAAMAVMCGLYRLVLEGSGPSANLLGFVHFAEVSVVSVLLGWVQLPRELRGQAPVRISRRQAALFFGAVMTGEVGVQLGLLPWFSWPPDVYLVAMLLQLAATLILFFTHRHDLIIHTDNITALLEERTASLRHAQEALALQNERQAQQLQEQARDLKAKAEVIERQRRLELAAQTAGQLAHDIQNLISPIHAQVARLEREPADRVSVQRIGQAIRNQADLLLSLNTQMLALARRGRMDFHPVDLDDLARAMQDNFPGRSLEIVSRNGIWVSGSWSQLSRALSNLVANAFEAGPSIPVRVRVERVEVAGVRRCHLGFLNPGSYAALSVRDCGPGIPAALLDRIFEPFFSSKDGRRSGSGLGLSIVSAVVDDHRGVLDLATGSQGTCFTLYLPSVEAPRDFLDPATLSGNETVMVIDDDSMEADRCARVLEEAGYAVLAAGDGHEALQLLQSEQADLLLLDLQMPRKNGFETFFAALHLRPGIRAVVHSSYVTGEEADRLKVLGVEALLQKPASRTALLQAVRRALDERQDSRR